MRYPVAPLAALMGSTQWMALDRLGVTGSHAQDYIRRGMSEKVADRVAIKAGLHPYVVWPEMLADDIAAAERECVAPDCPIVFVPPATGRGQKERHYCSRTCQVRTNRRRQRARAS